MAFIDLTIERPAWKRVEHTSEATEAASRDDEMEMRDEMGEAMMDEPMDTESSSGRGLFSLRRLLFVGAVAAAGALAVRRLRSRMGGEMEMETPIHVETPAEATAE